MYTNTSNPAAFGVEWQAGDNGNTYCLTNPRGTTDLIFGMRHRDTVEWHNVNVVNPTRFGLIKPPRTFAEFLAIVQAFNA